MKFTVKTLGLFAALSLFAACDSAKPTEEKKAEEVKTEEKAEEKAPEAHEGEKAPEGEEKAPEEAAPAEGGGGADKLGVAECDEYIEKFTACLDKLPEAAQGPAKEGFKSAIDAWKGVPAGPARDALAQGCQTALDAAKTSYASLGCEF